MQPCISLRSGSCIGLTPLVPTLRVRLYVREQKVVELRVPGLRSEMAQSHSNGPHFCYQAPCRYVWMLARSELAMAGQPLAEPGSLPEARLHIRESA